MQSKERHWPRYYYVIGTIAAVFTIVNALLAFTHYYPIAPVCQTTTLMTTISSQTIVGTTATATQVSTVTAVATASETTTATVSETTTTTTTITPAPVVVSINTDHEWVLTPDGKRAANIPVNASVTFTVKITNVGEAPVRVYGMIINVTFPSSYLSFGVSDDRLIEPGNSVELSFVLDKDFPHPSDVNFTEMVVTVYGEGWSKDQTVLICIAH